MYAQQSGVKNDVNNNNNSQASNKNSASSLRGRDLLDPSLITNAPRKKLEEKDFELLKTVGKGSFGKVFQVKMIENGQIYAMKVLSKEKVVARKQYQHTLAERRILGNLSHPFLVGLRYAFQSTTKLFMVFGVYIFVHICKWPRGRIIIFMRVHLFIRFFQWRRALLIHFSRKV